MAVFKQLVGKDDYYTAVETCDEILEYVNGLIIAQAAPSAFHQRIVTEVSRKIGNYIDAHNGKCGVFVAPFEVHINNDDIVQPDISVICNTSKITTRGCKGAPDFVIEVLSSNRAYDTITKSMLYEKSGVQEYCIIDPDARLITVRRFTDSSVQKYSMQYGFNEEVKFTSFGDKEDPFIITLSNLNEEAYPWNR